MPDCHKWSRREVVKLAGAATAASLSPRLGSAATPFSMPGLYPGRVIGVSHSGSSVNGQYQTAPIQAIMRRGMMELTGTSNYIAGWKKLFQPGDVVGIKVNPNGLSNIISSPACLLEIIQSLLLAGIDAKSIVVYERYQGLLATIQPWLPSWVRTSWATPGTWADDQTGISGYDPNYYVDLPGFLLPGQSASNPADTRSYAAQFISRQVTKVISLAVLKDHNGAGVTLTLKNLSNGCSNNVNRAHPDVSTNYLRNFIPSVVAMPVIRNKAVLGIVDGVHGLYAFGPYGGTGSCIWENRTMYFGTDLVALDRVGWRVIDQQRVNNGYSPEQTSQPDFGGGMLVRQPDHILVAGQMGLGEYRDNYIDYRTVTLA
jgi:hypothetical protein